MKKRVLSIFLALVMILALLPVSAFAATTASGTCGTNVSWKLSSDGTLAISGSGKMKDYTATSSPWSKYASEIETVTVGSGVTSLSSHAFYECTSLKSVSLSNSVTSIGKSAFYGCTSLTSVVLPNSVTKIDELAFRSCTRLKSISLGSGLQSIGESAFEGCTALLSITLPDSLTTLDEYAFGSCTALETVYFGNGLSKIGSYAFSSCTSLSDITISNSITNIGSYAFRNCTGLKNVNIGQGVKTIGSHAFYGCSKLKTVQFGNRVETIGQSSFQSCTSLESVSLPDSVTKIDKNAFYCCKNLKSVSTGNGVASIEESAFEQCSALKSVSLGEGLTTIGTYAFSACKCLTEIKIPEYVTTIGSYAFSSCQALKNAELGKRVKKIGSSAFRNCSSMSSIVIYNNVTDISSHAFYECSNLKKVYYTGTKTEWNEISIGESNTCLTNAKKYYEYVPHDHVYTATGTVEPTTQKMGYTKYTCSICGDSYKADYTLAAPTISIARSSGKPKISWSAIGGATKYIVYYSTNGKSYSKLITTTKLTVTNTKAASGKTYYYKVKAVGVVNDETIYSAYSNVKSMVTTLTAPTLSKTTSNGHPKISWKAVTGADKYIVYYSTNGKSYSKLITTTKLSVTHTKAKAGKTYYYKVKAVSNKSSNATSAYSKAVSIKAK